jgi:hypothetical protein
MDEDYYDGYLRNLNIERNEEEEVYFDGDGLLDFHLNSNDCISARREWNFKRVIVLQVLGLEKLTGLITLSYARL